MCTSIPVMNASASDAYPPPARTGPCHQTRKDDDEVEAAEVADDTDTPIISIHVNTQLEKDIMTTSDSKGWHGWDGMGWDGGEGNGRERERKEFQLP